MTLPLVLLAHPSANVRSAAADAFASRVAAAPDRAPPRSRLLLRAPWPTPSAKIAANGKPDLDDGSRLARRSRDASRGGVRRGASTAPASLRALAPLAAPADGGGSGGGDSSSSSSASFSFLRPGGSSRTLALARHLWSSSPKSGVITAARSSSPRGAERAGSSRQPEVVIGAAAACTAARADPRRATGLALPIRECLDASAPAPARVGDGGDRVHVQADALDFYLAFKVVAKRAPAAPDDPLVASRWAALLAHGAADADARPDAAAAVVAAAWASHARV